MIRCGAYVSNAYRLLKKVIPHSLVQSGTHQWMGILTVSHLCAGPCFPLYFPRIKCLLKLTEQKRRLQEYRSPYLALRKMLYTWKQLFRPSQPKTNKAISYKSTGNGCELSRSRRAAVMMMREREREREEPFPAAVSTTYDE